VDLSILTAVFVTNKPEPIFFQRDVFIAATQRERMGALRLRQSGADRKLLGQSRGVSVAETSRDRHLYDHRRGDVSTAPQRRRVMAKPKLCNS